MQHNFQSHFLEQLKEAETAGFGEHFHLFHSGLIISVSSRRIYSFEDLATIQLKESCLICKTSFLYITTSDGKKGTVFEDYL